MGLPGGLVSDLWILHTYRAIPRDPTFDIDKKIRNLIRTYLDNHTIDQNTAKFLSNSNPVIPVFYILPKIHKSLNNPPGRPIVASTDSILSPLSIYLEKILTPLIRTTKSFLLDTGHFSSLIREQDTIPPDSLLVTLDVNSLYTSITHERGITATRTLLQTSNMPDNSIKFCLDLLKLVLYENFFLYEDTYYVQCCGTAMGSNVAPAYANAYMSHFENNHVYPEELFKQYVRCYHRYIDDIFLIWTGSSELLLSFHQHLNSVHPELQFTIQYDTTVISFLDTMIHKNQSGKLTTDLFTKPTDCNNLLHYSSSHPRATKNSLPRSQFTRLAKIVSDPAILPIRLDTMSQKFKDRSYPARLLELEKKTTS
ncbi:unnamed protein product [Ranitomeya imitator]|uniref:Reverse transcriptase domain-containing protein n=1 Tax=Ranitomeya imitator TaxID=111125 RepID=A0ABN9LWG2_9NEOB|nr:unnamed protein product [Ranitomeya imitator]